MYAESITNKTTPYRMLVFPRLSEIMLTIIDKPKRMIDFKSNPKIKGISKITQAIATEGIVNPTQANADPNPRLMEV